MIGVALMIYEMSFAYNASFRLNREISFCMFAKISAGQIKFASIRSHRQQTNLFRKSNHELLHCTHPRHLHRLLLLLLHFVFLVVVVVVVVYCSRVLYESQIQMASSGTTLCCVCHVTLAICDIVANIKLGNVHADVSSRTKSFHTMCSYVQSQFHGC